MQGLKVKKVNYIIKESLKNSKKLYFQTNSKGFLQVSDLGKTSMKYRSRVVEILGYTSSNYNKE